MTSSEHSSLWQLADDTDSLEGVAAFLDTNPQPAFGAQAMQIMQCNWLAGRFYREACDRLKRRPSFVQSAAAELASTSFLDYGEYIQRNGCGFDAERGVSLSTYFGSVIARTIRRIDRGFQAETEGQRALMTDPDALGQIVDERQKPPEEILETRESVRRIRAAVDALGPRYQLLYHFRYVLDMSYAQIASEMNISVWKVRHGLRTTRQAVQDAFS